MVNPTAKDALVAFLHAFALASSTSGVTPAASIKALS